VVLGDEAGTAITTGDSMVAIGYQSLMTEDAQGHSTAVGAKALKIQNSGGTSYNVAVGSEAGTAVTTGVNNTILGAIAGTTTSTASNQVLIGTAAGALVTGDKNTFCGTNSGDNMTTGAKNAIFGRYNGNQGGVDIRTGSNNIVLSDGDGNPRVLVTSTGRLDVGNYTGNITSGDNARWYLANGSTGIWHNFFFGGTQQGQINLGNSGGVAYSTSSDYRLKENVDYTWDATTRLKQLKPSRFNFIADENDTTVDGFIAHEVQSVVPEAITGTKDEVDNEGNPVYQGIDQSKLVPLLVKTILELEARITALEG